MAQKYYLITTSFPGCLPEDGFVVTSQKSASESIQRIIDDYKDGWEYIWQDGVQVKNEDFEVETFHHAKFKKNLTGATIRYASYGGGVVVEMSQVDTRTAKEWSE